MLDILIPLYIKKETDWSFWKFLTFGIVKQNPSVISTLRIINKFTTDGFQEADIKKAITDSVVICRGKNALPTTLKIIGDDDGFIHSACWLTTQFKERLKRLN